MKNVIKIFAPSTEPNSLGARFRKSRFQLFVKLTKKLAGPLRILDIGGLEEYWIINGIANNPRYEITLLNLTAQEVHHVNFKSVIGDATNLHQYKKNEFDISFSNSVIDHLNSFDNQKKMAEEVRRVSKFYFVQCPYRYFPIEPHYLLPFAQFIPKQFLYSLLTKTKLSRGKIWDEEHAIDYLKEIRLMSIRELRECFPSSQIHKERFLGMVKSITVHNFK